MSPYRAPQCGTVSDRHGPVKSVWSFLEFEGIGGTSPLGERIGGDAQLAGPWLCAQLGNGVHLLLLTPELWGAPHMGSVLPSTTRFCGTCLQRSLWALLRFVFGNRCSRAKRNSVDVFNLVS